MISLGDGVEDTPRSVAAAERLSVSAPLDRYALSLQGKEYHKCRNSNSTGEGGGGDAERKQAVCKVR